jgi:hypothetical protein
MNQIERLQDELGRRVPGLVTDLDPPAEGRGPWFLTIRRGTDLPPVIVEWRPDRGYGLSTPDPDGADYGTGPDEVYPSFDATLGGTPRSSRRCS